VGEETLLSLDRKIFTLTLQMIMEAGQLTKHREIKNTNST
jgi:hypothetical protein